MEARFGRKRWATVLVALVCAVGAVNSASAQAEPLFEADAYPATIDGTALSASVFGFGIYAWTCHVPSSSGEVTAKSNALTLTATYPECSWSYPVTEPPQPYSVVKVLMNGCDYRLNSLKRVEADKYQGLASLECPVGKQMVVELNQGAFTICRLTVAAQSSKSDVGLIDKTGKEGTLDDLELQITIAKLKYTQDLSFCPVKIGTYEDLNYKGLTTLTATSGGKQVGFRVTGE